MIVFIVSASRAGSTMLDLMLGSHPECSSLGEFNRYKKTCGLCGVECEYWKQYNKYNKKYNCWTSVYKTFKTPILIDSSKKIHWVKEHGKKQKHKIIRIIRNGYDRMKTYIDRDGYLKASNVKNWVRKEKKITAFCNKRKHLLVKYEDICESNDLQRCCEFIGIDYRPEMREFWKIKHHAIPGSNKTYALLRKYHDVNLGNYETTMIENHGFEVKIRKRFVMSDKDYKTFVKNGGLKLNKKLGYKLCIG